MPDDLKRLLREYADALKLACPINYARIGQLLEAADRLEKAEALVPKWRQLAAVRRSGNDYSQEQADRLTICARELEQALAPTATEER